MGGIARPEARGEGAVACGQCVFVIHLGVCVSAWCVMNGVVIVVLV